MTDRRSFLLRASAAAAVPALASTRALAAPAQRRFEPGASGWRSFDVTTRVQIDTEAATQVWVPVPSLDSDWQRSLATQFSGNGAPRLVHDGEQGARMVHASFPAGTRAQLEVTSRVQTRDRAVDWNAQKAVREDASSLAAWTRPTTLIPTDGAVRSLALHVTEGARTDAQKASAIYDWISRNVTRDVAVRGCGEGDVRAMLRTAEPSGKCADINALFVGLCRSVGIPARDLYGVRLAPSAFGYRELGGRSEALASAQHCRAEAWLKGQGWVAMDPADVTKVMRQETSTWIRSVDDPVVAPVHARLKGCCEGNWMAYNHAHDIVLPGSTRGRLGFLMYPVAETADGRADSYAPDRFRYTITAREIAA